MTDWDAAACRRPHHHPDWWFPHDSDKATIAKAKAICKDCPIRIDCLVAHFDDPHGIYAATTPAERKRLTRPAPARDIDQVALARRANGDTSVTLTCDEKHALARQLLAAGASRTHVGRVTGLNGGIVARLAQGVAA